jgi:hypothetical protein
VNVVPGGPSGIPGTPLYTTQTATWLTADYHDVEMNPAVRPKHRLRTELLVPTP